jgi:glycosyltransferase involved in cell wall biosynthesis
MRRPLRVTLVTGAYHPQISSSALQCRAVAAALAGRVSFSVLTTATEPELPVREDIAQVPVYRVLVDAAHPTTVGAVVRLIAQYRRAAKGAEVVHLHGVSKKTAIVAALAVASRIPLVITLHTSGQDEPEAIRRLGAGAWWGLRRAARVVSVSPHLTACYLAAGLPPGRLVQIPNGIDLARFRPVDGVERQRVKRELGLPSDPMVLFVGFFSRDKRPDFLFDAWQRSGVSRCSTLVFVGASRGSYREIDHSIVAAILESARASGLADRVRVIEPTHHIERYYNAASAYVLSSRREAMPVALLEAMASGLPVAATNLAGVTDRIILDGDNGRLFDLDDVEGLAAILATLVEDDRVASAFGERARRTIVERYSLDSIAAQWLNVYQQVAA